MPIDTATKNTGSASLSCPLKHVATTAAVAITEATERSSPRTKITSTCPMTTMPSGAACNSMLEMLLAVRKAGDKIAVTTISATKTRWIP